MIPRYETHITVDGRRRQQWTGHCEALHVKPLVIELDTGDSPIQVMCTDNNGKDIASLERAFACRGHVVMRTKREVELRADTHHGYYAEALYFEAHIKLPLYETQRLTLEDVAGRAGLALSRSTLRLRADGRVKWFLTDRCRMASHFDALAVFDESLAIVRADFPGATMECEGVLADTASHLDNGWTNADIGRL